MATHDKTSRVLKYNSVLYQLQFPKEVTTNHENTGPVRAASSISFITVYTMTRTLPIISQEDPKTKKQ